jgi:two-component system sensor histidine kinase KdpD
VAADEDLFAYLVATPAEEEPAMSGQASDVRPNPDQLLQRIQQEEAHSQRGKLKIFFGASPGVGKTYAMLQAARRLREQGMDVVVGLVETHGRQETAALLEGLEQLPLKEVSYRERTLREFDLDAALARRPALILVDELAHSNAPGSRHPKRWQDIEELLDAGINVLTTINVQHLESLNDVVGGLTGIRVWETVTDRMFDQADEVVLVDLPPDELLQRLKEGKVYLPEQAERAIRKFLPQGQSDCAARIGAAAHRRPGGRPDAEHYQQRDRRHTVALHPRGAAGLRWPGTRRRGAGTCCQPAGPTSSTRNGTRCTSRRPALQRLPEARRRAILGTLKLAQELGAQTATQAAADIASAIRRLRPATPPGAGWWSGAADRADGGSFDSALAEQLAQQAPKLDLLALARTDVPQRLPDPKRWRERRRPSRPSRRAVASLWGHAAGLCLGTALATTPLLPYLDLTNIAMLFLLGVVGVAVRYGRGPAVLAAIVNVLAFDFFFVHPRSLALPSATVQYLLTFAVMLIVGLVVGQLTARYRYQAQISGAREQRARHLYRDVP